MFRRPFRHGTYSVLLAAFAVCSAVSIQAIGAELNPATHKQVRVIAPKVDGREVSLKTFCLDPSGDLLICCGPPIGRRSLVVSRRDAKPNASGAPRGMIQIYSPDGELKKTIPLDFVPTAINLGPRRELFVAGEGQLCRLDEEGRVLAKTATPNIQDMEKFREEVARDAREMAKKSVKRYEDYIAQRTAQIEKITETPEEDRTALQKSQLKMLEQQKSLFEQSLERMKQRANVTVNVDVLVKSKLKVTGLAVSSRDVFVSCATTKGYGYDVWRVDHDLKDPKEIIQKLRGCCGQMDIQCSGDDLLVAANTKFKVSRYDRDGNLKSEFGENVRKSPEGFGSCCNPMNVLCTPDGVILTAEASIGNIKRFDAEGNFLGFVGKAKIGGGCKHCALGYDQKRDRYYMQRQDSHHICVLVPLSEAPEFTQEELQAKEAREGLGKKLVGKWQRVEDPDAKQQNARPIVSMRASQAYEFGESGELKLSAGLGAPLIYRPNGMQWKAVKQEGDTLDIVQVRDQVESYTLRIVFAGDDEATIATLYSGRVLYSGKYRRAK